MIIIINAFNNLSLYIFYDKPIKKIWGKKVIDKYHARNY